MTDEQINRAIAEACGWKWHDHPNCMAKKIDWTMPEKWIMRPDGVLVFRHDIPNYCNDLNAMHEAEKIIMGDWHLWEKYACKLISLLGADHFAASARLRAEAFLRTLGKWATTEESSVDQKEVQP